MNANLTAEQLQPIIEAVRNAASLCRTVQETEIVASEKAGREPVTIADYGSQAIICRAIRGAFPDDGVISEERGHHFLNEVADAQRTRVVSLVGEILGESVTEEDIVSWLDHGRDRDTQRTWVIDPIDGTKGFLAQRSYTIAVGFLVDKKPAAGVMGSPGYETEDGMGKLFYAAEGKAYAQNMSGGDVTQILVSDHAGGDTFAVVESVESKHADHEGMAQVYKQSGFENPIVKRVDGQDKYAMIASGDADLYLRVSPKRDYKEKVWDHAAGVALIMAAGGTVTDLHGKALDFSLGEKLENNTFVVVSNGRSHAKILESLQAQYTS
jgi:3'(2'), 5'-bisphosphate nucleotidase